MSPNLLTAQQTADFLHISRPTLYLWVSRGRAPKPIYLAKRCPRWRLEDLRAWLESLREQQDAA